MFDITKQYPTCILNFSAEHTCAFKFMVKKVVSHFIQDLSKSGKKRLLIWGAGEHTRTLIENVDFSPVLLLGIVDKYKKGTAFGYNLISPDEAPKLNPDAVLISSRIFMEEIYNQIKDLFTKETQFLKIYDLGNFEFAKQKSVSKLNSTVFDPDNLNITEDTVVYISDMVPNNLVRQSIAMREKGINTCLILLGSYSENINLFLSKHFNTYLNLSSQVEKYGIYNILKLVAERFKPRVFHIWSMWAALYLPLIVKKFARSPVVCEFNDIFSAQFLSKDFGELYGKNYEVLVPAYEKQIMQTVDGVIHKESPLITQYLNEKYNNACPVLEFMSYPSKQFYHYNQVNDNIKEASIRLAFTGSVSPKITAKLTHNATMLKTVKLLAKEKIYVDVFIPSEASLETGFFQEYIQFAEESPYFTISNGLMPGPINSKISTYDFGLVAHYFDKTARLTDFHNNITMASKLFTYYESGLPTIVAKKFVSMAEHAEENGVGVAVSSNNLVTGITQIIQKLDYAKMKKNVQTFCENNFMENHIHKMLSFYDCLK